MAKKSYGSKPKNKHPATAQTKTAPQITPGPAKGIKRESEENFKLEYIDDLILHALEGIQDESAEDINLESAEGSDWESADFENAISAYEQREFAGGIQRNLTGGIQREFAGGVQREFTGGIQRNSAGVIQCNSAGGIQRNFAGDIQRNSAVGVQREFTGGIQCNSAGVVHLEFASGVQRNYAGDIQRNSAVGVQREFTGGIQREFAGGIQLNSAGGVQSTPLKLEQGPAADSEEIQSDSSDKVDEQPAEIQIATEGGNVIKEPGESVTEKSANKKRKKRKKKPFDVRSALKKMTRRGEKALQDFVDRGIDVYVSSPDYSQPFKTNVQKISDISFYLLESVMQCWIALCIFHVFLLLLQSTGIGFTFPVEFLSNFMSNVRKYLSKDFKLLGMSLFVVFFINDLVNAGNRGRYYLHRFFVLVLFEVVAFSTTLHNHDWSDQVYTVMAVCTVGRISAESLCSHADEEERDTVFRFVPLFLFTQLVVFLFYVCLVLLIETSKYVEFYVPDTDIDLFAEMLRQYLYRKDS